MRRILPIALGCLLGCFLAAFPLFAQRGGGHGGGGGMRGGGGGMRGGFSGGAFRGGGGFRGGGYRGGGYRGVGGYRGFRGYGRYGYGFYGGLWGYPWLYSGLYDSCFLDFDDCYGYPDYGAGYADNGGYYPSYAPSYSQPSPGVVIISNQLPPQPNIVPEPPAPAVWNAPPASQTSKYEEPLYLLAMNDGTIRAVLAYWVDGKTVHYVTMDHMQKTAPLGSLDRGLSERLNRERNVTFSLPG